MKKVVLVLGFIAMLTIVFGCAGTAVDTAKGKKLAQEICVRCHSYDKVTGHRADKAGWSDIIERMKGYGAVINAEEATAIADYLAESQPLK